MSTVLTIGESMIELVSSGRREAQWTFAGDALNCAAAIAAINPDAHVSHLTGLGDDHASAQFFDFCASLGVDASRSLVLSDRRMGLYWIDTFEGERRFQYWRSESAARHLLQSGALVVGPVVPSLIVFSGITLAVAGDGAMRLLEELATARRNGATIAFDTNHRTALWPDLSTARPMVELAMARSDVVHASAEDVETLFEQDADIFLSGAAQSSGPSELVVTRGGDSVLALTSGQRIEYEPQRLTPVDTTGAGDAFFGSYLGARMGGISVPDALEAAAAVGGRAVMAGGALGYLRQDF